jgi:hypothetical protein
MSDMTAAVSDVYETASDERSRASPRWADDKNDANEFVRDMPHGATDKVRK